MISTITSCMNGGGSKPVEGSWIGQDDATCLVADGNTVSCRMSGGPAGDKINAVFQFLGWNAGLDTDANLNGDPGENETQSSTSSGSPKSGIKHGLRSTATKLMSSVNMLRQQRDSNHQDMYWEFHIKNGGEMGSVWVGAIQWPHFTKGWSARGFSYGGNLSDGAALLAQDFGHRLKTGDVVGLHVERDDVTGIRIAVWHNNRPFGDAFAIDAPLKSSGLLLPWVSFSTSGPRKDANRDAATASVSILVLGRSYVPPGRLINLKASRTVEGKWKASGMAVLQGTRTRDRQSKQSKHSSVNTVEPEAVIQDEELENLSAVLVITSIKIENEMRLSLKCKVGNVLSVQAQKVGKPAHWQVVGTVASTRMMVGPEEDAIENRMYAVLSGLLDFKLAADDASGAELLRVEGPGEGEFTTFAKDLAVEKPVARADLMWDP